MAWGTTPWGITPTRWGLGPIDEEFPDGNDFHVDHAYAIGSHVVRVYLTGAPRAESALQAGDALNPLVWNVRLEDGSAQYTVLSVRQGGTSLIWDLYVLQELQSEGTPHRVTAATLVNPQGILIGNPNYALFGGTLAPLQFAENQSQPYDIANSDPAATFTVDSSGDLKKERGVPLVKKLIIRRIMTTTGAFVHLPNYGIGIKVKEPLATHDLVSLQSLIERGIMSEPEIDAVSVRLRLESNGTLIIVVRAVLESGQQTMIEVPVKQLEA